MFFLIASLFCQVAVDFGCSRQRSQALGHKKYIPMSALEPAQLASPLLTVSGGNMVASTAKCFLNIAQRLVEKKP
jgi:hypothetical protein